MTYLKHLLRKWMLLSRRERREQELEDEINSHLAIEVQQRIERGESPEDARLHARREFGNIALVKDVTRDVWGRRWLDEIRDFSHAMRGLLRHWKMTAVAIVSLSIAMAVGVISLSITNTFLLLAPAGTDPDRLVVIYSSARDEAIGQVSYPDYEYYRENNHVFTDIAASPISIGVATDFNGVNISQRQVSDNYFAVLGIHPYIGRLFSPGDNNTKNIAVITYGCWKRLGADPNIVGKKIAAYTVIGVTPKEFTGSFFGVDGDVLSTLADSKYSQQSGLTKRDVRRLSLIGRLKPGITKRRAQADMSTLSAQLAAAYPKEDKDRSAVVTRATMLPPDAIPTVELVFGILLGLVLMVLVIACANVGNLLLAIAVGRRQEAAIKLALGVRRGRLIREFLKESAIICASSSALGYILASTLIVRYSRISVDLPNVGSYSIGLDLRLDGTVLLFTFAVMMLAIVATGLAPALYASSPNLGQILSGEGVVGGTHKTARRNILVMAHE